MLPGKRRRSPMRRTTSMTGINVDLGDVDESESSNHPHRDSLMDGPGDFGAHEGQQKRSVVVGSGPSGFDHRLMATVSPRYNRRSSGGVGGGDHVVIETADFLRTCGLCNRRLKPGRDIYMYRGDTAFCSQECREQQMKHDEREEKYSMVASKNDENHQHNHRRKAPATTTTTATSDP